MELWQRSPSGDTKLYDTQVLSAENNWRYVWENLPQENNEYYCVEKNIPEKYTVSEETAVDQSSSDRRRINFIITNTYKETPPTTTSTGIYTRTKRTELPYTGMLWWPVPFLGAGGLAMVLIGVIGKKRRRSN